MADKQSDNNQIDHKTHKINLKIDGKGTPILYTDAVYVYSNQYGVVLDVAQRIGTTNEQVVVARLGMSIESAKNMIKAIHEHLEKHER